jgi:hypothetical protein
VLLESWLTKGSSAVLKLQGELAIDSDCDRCSSNLCDVDRVVTRRNTLHRHLHLMGLTDSPLCRNGGVEEETFAHILCRCEALTSIRHAYLGSFFLEPEDIKSENVGPSGALARRPGSHERPLGHKGPVSFRPRCIGDERPRTHIPI